MVLTCLKLNNRHKESHIACVKNHYNVIYNYSFVCVAITMTTGLTSTPGEKMVRAWHVQFSNEWNMTQERVVALSTHSYFRVKFDRKTGKIIKHVRLPMPQVVLIEELAGSKTGIVIYSR